MCGPSSWYWCPARVPRRSIVRTPFPPLTKVTLWGASKERDSTVTGTWRASDLGWSDANNSNVVPFSIFKSVKIKMRAALASSVMVSQNFSRKFLTSGRLPLPEGARPTRRSNGDPR